MEMEINREIYIPKKKNWGYMPQPGQVDQDNWWYWDAVFDNGWSHNTAFRVNDLKGNVICEMMDPKGKLYGKMIKVNPKLVVASTEELDCKVGENHIWGEYPRYFLKIDMDDVGLDLTYDCEATEFMEPPDGCYIGRAVAPTTPMYFTYLLHPRCKIYGNLRVGDKTFPVKNGYGYADHQWGNGYFPAKQLFYYYWGKSCGPKHTLIWWDTVLDETQGYQRMKWMWAYKGDKLLAYARDTKFYVETSDYTDVDQTNGICFPRVVRVLFDDPKVKGSITYTMRHNYADLYPRTWAPMTLHRHFSDCETKLEMDGEKMECHSLELHELALR